MFGCKIKKNQQLYQDERNRNFSCLSGRARCFSAYQVKLIVNFSGRYDRTRLLFRAFLSPVGMTREIDIGLN